MGRLLTETTQLSLLGGGPGIGLAVWLLGLLASVDFPFPSSGHGQSPSRRARPGVHARRVVGGHPVPSAERRYRAPARTWPAPSGGSVRTAGNPVSSTGATRWSSRSSRPSLVLLAAARVSLPASTGTVVDPSFGREPTTMLTLQTPSTLFTPGEAGVYARRLLDRFRELERLQTSTGSSPRPIMAPSSRTGPRSFPGSSRLLRGRNFTTPTGLTPPPWSSSARRWPDASGPTETRAGLKLAFAWQRTGAGFALCTTRLPGGLLFEIDTTRSVGVPQRAAHARRGGAPDRLRLQPAWCARRVTRQAQAVRVGHPHFASN